MKLQKHAREALAAINDNIRELGARAEVVGVGGNCHYRVQIWLGDRPLARPIWLSCSPSDVNGARTAARYARRTIAEAQA